MNVFEQNKDKFKTESKEQKMKRGIFLECPIPNEMFKLKTKPSIMRMLVGTSTFSMYEIQNFFLQMGIQF